MIEHWADIDGYEDLYRVSDQGHVESYYSGAWKRLRSGQNSSGYLCVLLYRAGAASNERVSRLVAQAFVPNPEGKPEINHKDGNKLNNAATNLEWVTHMENMHHAMRLGLLPRGERHGSSKLTRIQVKEIRKLYAAGDHTQKELGTVFGVSDVMIHYIVRRKCWVRI